MSRTASEQLADMVREVSPTVAIEVTDAFLQRHPDWQERYGDRARSAGVQAAGYHLAFLAGAYRAVASGRARRSPSGCRWQAR